MQIRVPKIVIGEVTATIEQKYENARLWQIVLFNRSLSSLRLTPADAREIAEVITELATACEKLNEESADSLLPEA